MKIESSTVAMAGQSVKIQKASVSQSPVFASSLNQPPENATADKGPTISEEGRRLLNILKQPVPLETVPNKFEDPDQKDYRIKLLESMLEALTGKRFSFLRFKEGTSSDQANTQPNQIPGVPMRNARAANQLFVQQKTEYFEKEAMSFSMKAQVKTSDGKSIDVELELNMSREFYASNTTTAAAVFKDPLVINFDAPSAALSSTKFAFDIDCDGSADQVSQLMNGSGFLALDLNNDGKVNDGNELFGAKSGDGFKDLAKHDEDGNGWIDENDEIFDKLRIWVKDENGKDTLFSLGEKGIGAIYLGNVNTAFELKDGAATNGVIRKTGFFLREDSTAGTVQHVDLVV